jgi:hypothetical protein
MHSWRKSSFSFSNGNCTEVASSGAGVLVRDSKQAGTGPVLAFPPQAWREFAGRVKRDEGASRP